MRQIPSYLALLLCAGAVAGEPQEIPILTVCEALHSAGAYDAKSIIVVGHLDSTFEGSWISESCAEKVTVNGAAWTPTISAAIDLSRTNPPPNLPNRFRWDQRALQAKLAIVMTTTHPRKSKPNGSWEAIFGRLETHPPTWIRGNAMVTQIGFGHLSIAPAQIVSPENGWRKLSAKR